mgnify:FL=1
MLPSRVGHLLLVTLALQAAALGQPAATQPQGRASDDLRPGSVVPKVAPSASQTRAGQCGT